MRTVVLVSAIWFAVVSNGKCDYTGAVVEYAPLTETTANATVETNLKQYEYFIESAKKSSVQIIVFPEYGLTGLVDDPKPYAIEVPRTGDGPQFNDYWLQILSNAARENSMYVVVNLLEKANNGTNATLYYNTNVVFDKNGKIAAKYRKINLRQEHLLTPGDPSENQITFTTDFGVTFGVFICFDILNYNPSRTILNNTFVTDIVFPTAWDSVLPFYESLSVQSSYAVAAKVNLLAANANNISEGVSGSGIYGSDGTIYAHYIAGLHGNQMLIAKLGQNVPIRTQEFETFGFDITDKSDLSKLYMSRAFDSSKYKFSKLDLSASSIQKKLCYGSFCCEFAINLTAALNTTDVFQLVAYKGPVDSVDDVHINVKICSILVCETSDPSTCGTRTAKSTTKFREISIRTSSKDGLEQFYQPISLTTDLLPVFNITFNSTVVNGTRTTSLTTTNEVDNILALGIFGNGSATINLSFIILLTVTFVNYFCN